MCAFHLKMWAKDGPSNGSPDLEKNNSKQHGICIKINHLCGGFWESLIFSHTQINTKKVFASPKCFLIVLASRHDESFGIVSLFFIGNLHKLQGGSRMTRTFQTQIFRKASGREKGVAPATHVSQTVSEQVTGCRGVDSDGEMMEMSS